MGVHALERGEGSRAECRGRAAYLARAHRSLSHACRLQRPDCWRVQPGAVARHRLAPHLAAGLDIRSRGPPPDWSRTVHRLLVEQFGGSQVDGPPRSWSSRFRLHAAPTTRAQQWWGWVRPSVAAALASSAPFGESSSDSAKSTARGGSRGMAPPSCKQEICDSSLISTNPRHTVRPVAPKDLLVSAQAVLARRYLEFL